MEIQDYLKSLNPQKADQSILIYGSTYKLWRDNEFIGEAVWTKDDNVGDSFQNVKYIDGQQIREVFVADFWELVVKK